MRLNFIFFALSFSATIIPTWAEDADLKGASSNWPSELMLRMQEHSVNQPEIFSQALKVIEGLKSSPSCMRLAASTLVDTCQSLDYQGGDNVDPQTVEVALDEVKSEFAARLAMCELAGARATLPEQCVALTPSSKACPRSRFGGLFSRKQEDPMDKICYSAVSDAQIKSCLKAFEDRPQWWTSYSNARQNAMVLCQASRDLIEKDKTIDIYKALTEEIANLTTHMHLSVKEQALALEESREFAELLRSLQKDAVRAFENGNKDAQRMLAKFMADMQTAVGLEIEKYVQALGKTESQVDSLTQVVMQSGSQVASIHQEAVGALNSLMRQLAEGITEQNQLFEYGQGLGLAMVKAFEDARRTQSEDLDATSASLRTVRAEMDFVGRSFAEIGQSQVVVHQGLAEVMSTISSLQQTAEKMKTTLNETSHIINGLAGLVSLARYWQYLLIFLVFIIAAFSVSKKLIATVITLAVLFLTTTHFFRHVPEVSDPVFADDTSLPRAIPWDILIWIFVGVLFVVIPAIIVVMARRNTLSHYGDLLLPRIEVPRFPMEKTPLPGNLRPYSV